MLDELAREKAWLVAELRKQEALLVSELAGVRGGQGDGDEDEPEPEDDEDEDEDDEGEEDDDDDGDEADGERAAATQARLEQARFFSYQDHHMLPPIELRLALISYQDYHVLLLTLAGARAGGAAWALPARQPRAARAGGRPVRGKIFENFTLLESSALGRRRSSPGPSLLRSVSHTAGGKGAEICP